VRQKKAKREEREGGRKSRGQQLMIVDGRLMCYANFCFFLLFSQCFLHCVFHFISFHFVCSVRPDKASKTGNETICRVYR